jgi:hypothetical protein
MGINRFTSLARNVRSKRAAARDPRVQEYNKIFLQEGVQFNSVEAADKAIANLETRIGTFTSQVSTQGADVRRIRQSINDLTNRQTNIESMRAILDSVRSEGARDPELRAQASVAFPGPLRDALGSALSAAADEFELMQVFMKPDAQLRPNSLDTTVGLFRQLAAFDTDSPAHKDALDRLVEDMVPLAEKTEIFTAQQGALVQFMQQEVDVDGQPITAGEIRKILIDIRRRQKERAAAMKQSVDPAASRQRGAQSILGASSEAALQTTSERARRRGR